MTPAHVIHGAGVELAERAARAWRDEALCKDSDSAVWFPTSEQGKPAPDWATPKAICEGCPVRQPCLDYALTASEPEGVWGGATPAERREMVRSGRKGVPKKLAGAARPARCKLCGTTFDARDSRQIYCSVKCADRAREARRRAS